MKRANRAKARETESYEKWLVTGSQASAAQKKPRNVARQQWARFWVAKGLPPPPLQGLRQQAIAQASLPAVSLIASLTGSSEPAKAPGLDGRRCPC